jgi:aryl-alcohol dehydrogenase-like predicted oxidoreductase
MEPWRVRATGVFLSRVGLGGVWLGEDATDAAQVSRALGVIEAAAEAGTNWVDTSENYFDTGNEAVIGAALRNMRGAFQVCSKAAPGAHASGGGSGFRPEQIRDACEGSLARLGVEVIDVYLLHWPDDTGVPLADTWSAMAALVDDGLVRAIGMSNYDREDIEACNSQREVDVIQTGLSIVDYLEDRDLIAWCGEQGMTVTIYEPLAGGVLTDLPFEEARDRYVGSAWEDSGYFRRLFTPDKAPRTERVVNGLREVASQLGTSVAQLSLAWVLRQPGVGCVIAGSANPARVRANAATADLDVPDAAIQAIDELVPLGPAFT